MTIGKRIRNLRKMNEMTLKELAGQCSISVSFLCDIEKDRRQPSLESIKEIARALEISVSYLLEDQHEGDTKRPYSIQDKSLQFREVLEKIEDFDNWKREDQEELLTYLELKKKIRAAQEKKKRS